MFQFGLVVVHQEDIVHGQSALRQVLQKPGLLLDACQGQSLQRSTPAGFRSYGPAVQRAQEGISPGFWERSLQCTTHAGLPRGAQPPGAKETWLGKVH